MSGHLIGVKTGVKIIFPFFPKILLDRSNGWGRVEAEFDGSKESPKFPRRKE